MSAKKAEKSVNELLHKSRSVESLALGHFLNAFILTDGRMQRGRVSTQSERPEEQNAISRSHSHQISSSTPAAVIRQVG